MAEGGRDPEFNLPTSEDEATPDFASLNDLERHLPSTPPRYDNPWSVPTEQQQQQNQSRGLIPTTPPRRLDMRRGLTPTPPLRLNGSRSSRDTRDATTQHLLYISCLLIKSAMSAAVKSII